MPGEACRLVGIWENTDMRGVDLNYREELGVGRVERIQLSNY